MTLSNYDPLALLKTAISWPSTSKQQPRLDKHLRIGLAFVAGAGGRQPSWLVRPPQLVFDPDFIKIHGITADQVAGKPNSAICGQKIRQLLEGRIIIAPNAEFDINVSSGP
jgi:DNA polymerase III epsilon subunit-like protein